MKTTKTRIVFYLAIVAVLIYIISTIETCNKPKGTQTVEVIVPEKKGSFEKPTSTIEYLPGKDSVVYKSKTIYTENPVNKELANSYITAKDSLEQLKLYLKAIEEKEKTSVFDNEDVKIEVYTKTRGELLDIKSKYTIKEKTIKAAVPQKQTVLALYGGGEVISNQGFDNFALKADIGIQNRKGTIISLGIDNRNNYYLGAKFRLINIKK